jgi:hypothetical protein
MVENRTPHDDSFAYLFRSGHADTGGTASDLSDDTLPQIASETLVLPASMATGLAQTSAAQPYGVGAGVRHWRGRALTLMAVLVLGAVLGAGGTIVVGGALDGSQVAAPTMAPEVIPTAPEVIPSVKSVESAIVPAPAKDDEDKEKAKKKAKKDDEDEEEDD